MGFKVIDKHKLTETVLTQYLGWDWFSYIGTPVKGTPGYPAKCRVRQLFSPKALKQEWVKYLQTECEWREADMTEPLDYSYCSSQGGEIPPRILILVEER